MSVHIKENGALTKVSNIKITGGGIGDLVLLHSAGLTRSQINGENRTIYTFTEDYDIVYVVGSIGDNDAVAGCTLTYTGGGTATEIDSKTGTYSSSNATNTKVLKIENVSENDTVEIARTSTDGQTGTWFIFNVVVS